MKTPFFLNGCRAGRVARAASVGALGFASTISIVTAIFLAALCAGLPGYASAEDIAVTSRQTFVAYYFHTSVRCRTCLLIEERSEDILRYEFSDRFQDGTLQWQSVNVQLDQNRHFLNDLSVHSKSLVLVEYRDSLPRERRILKRVWGLIHDEDPSNFDTYVAGETRAFLEEGVSPP